MTKLTCNGPKEDSILNRLDEILADFGGEKIIFKALENEKLILIDDIMRVKRLAGCLDPKHLNDTSPKNWYNTFAALYDSRIDVLEAYLAALSKKVTEYMRGRHEVYMSQNNPAEYFMPWPHETWEEFLKRIKP